ncbi:uncharacterized protein MYCFIDRAFT_212355 [Pseudocercospora fijiensis CIRAD86]|uniref:F-box domain-containing protein n=1 Tax=Pseudocercospora fijiensis (strain CIRAD86) TaxID=383855 RepID=M3ALJ5_PSEFD|nr:uncharacterized protein MYCFIDRAFT_212355 [Pseudocercospora fijiensis CIRAD86]EME78302.1 hypothetical protein MYCFIDRAFT_212355 [Pseudocercospora fijiensis CIRAD86]
MQELGPHQRLPGAGRVFKPRFLLQLSRLRHLTSSIRRSGLHAMSYPKFRRPKSALITQNSPISAEELREGLATLPQELYDNIYDLTFTAADGVRDLGEIESSQESRFHFARLRFAHRNFRPSAVEVFREDPGAPFTGKDSRTLLQVDRASRRKFAASYYGGVFLARNRLTAVTWLRSVSLQHRALVREMWVMDSFLQSSRGPSRRDGGFRRVQYIRFGPPEQIELQFGHRHPGLQLPPQYSLESARRMRPEIEAMVLEMLRSGSEWSDHRAPRRQRARILGE